MQRTAVIAIAALLASPLGFLGLDAMGVTGGFEETVPTWNAGDRWVWDMTVDASGEGHAMGVGGASEVLHVEGTRVSEILNTQLSFNERPAYVALERFQVDTAQYGDKVVYDRDACDDTRDCPASPDGDEFASVGYGCLGPCGDEGALLALYTKDDLGLVLDPYAYSDLFDGLQSDEPATVSAEMAEEAERFRELVMHRTTFPLDKGNTWTLFETTEPGFLIQIDAEAVEQEYIRLPDLGPTEVIRIEARLTDESRNAFHDFVEQEASKESDGQVNVDLNLDLRWQGWYSPEYRNLVQTITSWSLAGRAAGGGFSAAFQAQAEVSEVLRAHSDKLQPERSLEEAAALVGAAWDDDDINAPLSAQTFLFTAVADETDHVLDHDDDEVPTVTLGIVEGRTAGPMGVHADSLPSDMTFKWSHSAPGAMTPAALDGENPTVPLEQAGIHVFTARAYDTDGRLAGVDNIVLDVDETMTLNLHEEQTSTGLVAVAHHGEATVDIGRGARSLMVLPIDTLFTDGRTEVLSPDGTVMGSTYREPIAMQGSSEDTDIVVDNPVPGTWTITDDVTAQAGASHVAVFIDYDPAFMGRGAVDHHTHATHGSAPVALPTMSVDDLGITRMLDLLGA